MSSARPNVIARICPCTDQTCLAVEDAAVSVPQHKVTVPLTAVFEKASQSQMYDAVSGTVYAAAEEGLNATVLTYGQTGSGKTYTLLGTSDAPGIVPRVFERLGQAVQKDSSMTISISVVEIYCEKIKDLLNPTCPSEDLTITRDNLYGCHVSGAKYAAASSSEEMLSYLEQGLENRAVRSTGMNSESSRSHLLIYCFMRRSTEGGHIINKLCLADLAGSERQNKTKAEGVSLSEGCAINKSLSALGLVLKALSEGGEKDAHIPFRDSKLTRLLQDCLVGNTLMALILCMSPNKQHASETVSTLRFGSRALGITSVCTVNRQVSLQELLAENREIKKQLQTLKGQLDRPSKEHTPAASQPSGVSSASPPLSKDTYSIMGVIQSHWVLVALTMQTVYLCFMNAALSSH